MIKALKKWWMEKKKAERRSTIITGIVAILMSVAAIVLLVLSPHVEFISASVNAAGAVGKAGIGEKILGTFFYILVFIGFTMVIRGLLFVLFIAVDKKTLTIVKLISSAIKYGMGIALIFMILSVWGVPVMAQLAAAGILALVIGLGAQSIISDILAGLNIVFENQYNVGDIVYIDGFRGTILEIGLTTTKIVDASGNVKIINNSKISTVVNLSANVSVVIVEVGVEYGENLPKLEELLQENMEAIRQRNPMMLSAPVYMGVSKLGDSSVVLKFSVQVEEPNRYAVERALYRELYLLFTEHQINIPFPQVTISSREEK